MKISFLKKADVIIIAVLLIIAALLLLPKYLKKSDSLKAEIIRDGKIIETVNLNEVKSDRIIDLGDATILVKNGSVAFADADCPDKLCVKCGILKRSGDTAVCVPTKTVVRVVGSGSEIDAISY